MKIKKKKKGKWNGEVQQDKEDNKNEKKWIKGKKQDKNNIINIIKKEEESDIYCPYGCIHDYLKDWCFHCVKNKNFKNVYCIQK